MTFEEQLAHAYTTLNLTDQLRKTKSLDRLPKYHLGLVGGQLVPVYTVH